MNVLPNSFFSSNQLRVYLDGVEVKDVVRANSETGEVEVYLRSLEGNYVVTLDPSGAVTRVLTGEVRFGIRER